MLVRTSITRPKKSIAFLSLITIGLGVSVARWLGVLLLSVPPEGFFSRLGVPPPNLLFFLDGVDTLMSSFCWLLVAFFAFMMSTLQKNKHEGVKRLSKILLMCE